MRSDGAPYGAGFRADASSPSVSPVPASIPSAVLLALLAGCGSAQGPVPASAEHEADIACYWSAERHAGNGDVRKALADGELSSSECSDIVMPHVEKGLLVSRAKARENAVRAASAIEARSDETGTGAAVGKSAGPQDDAQPSAPSLQDPNPCL